MSSFYNITTGFAEPILFSSFQGMCADCSVPLMKVFFLFCSPNNIQCLFFSFGDYLKDVLIPQTSMDVPSFQEMIRLIKGRGL